jgi:hypothetical protein
MKNTKSLLAALILVGSMTVNATAFAADGVISKSELSSDGYCHLKFPAIQGKTLPTDNPTLKSPESGDISDFYGPCDYDPTGKSQVHEQRLHWFHHYVTEFYVD